MTGSRSATGPAHDVTVTLVFRALMNERDVLPQLLAAGDDLDAETRELAARHLATAAPRAE